MFIIWVFGLVMFIVWIIGIILFMIASFPDNAPRTINDKIALARNLLWSFAWPLYALKEYQE